MQRPSSSTAPRSPACRRGTSTPTASSACASITSSTSTSARWTSSSRNRASGYHSADVASRLEFPYRLAAIDIDDTLVGPDKQVSEENRAAINRLQAAGCRVVLASGREHHSMADLPGTARDWTTSWWPTRAPSSCIPQRAAAVARPVSARPCGSSAVARGRAEGFDVLLATDEGFVASPTTLGRRRTTRSATARCACTPATSTTKSRAPLKVLWFGDTADVHAFSRVMTDELGDTAEVVITTAHLLEFNAPDATKAAAWPRWPTLRHRSARGAGIRRQPQRRLDAAMGRARRGDAACPARSTGRRRPHCPEADPDCALAVVIDLLLAGTTCPASGCSQCPCEEPAEPRGGSPDALESAVSARPSQRYTCRSPSPDAGLTTTRTAVAEVA